MHGEYSGLILAAARLEAPRPGDSESAVIFQQDEILPAAGQGILAVQGQTRSGHMIIWKDIEMRMHGFAGSAERAFVKYLNGGCSSPVAAYGVVEGDELFLRGLYYRECDGRYFKDSIRGPKAEAEKLGRDLAKRMQES